MALKKKNERERLRGLGREKKMVLKKKEFLGRTTNNNNNSGNQRYSNRASRT